jgi:hypothetical protein
MIDDPRFYVFIILGVALIAAVFAYVATGGRLPGMTNSPTADMAGKTAQ